MKSYEEMMEAMSLKDMKDLGGTDAQKKIAQDRQKAREAKNRGFDSSKEVLKDKPSSMVKAEPKSITKKPDLRKSQLGKWSQGVKNSPGKLAKKTGAIVKAPESKPAAPEVDKVKVKTDGSEGQQGNRPGSTKELGKGVVNNMKNKVKDTRSSAQKYNDLSRAERAQQVRDKNKAAKNAKTAEWDAKAPGSRAASVANKARKAVGKVAKGALGAKTGETGVSRSGDLEGLSGRDKGLIG